MNNVNIKSNDASLSKKKQTDPTLPIKAQKTVNEKLVIVHNGSDHAIDNIINDSDWMGASTNSPVIARL